MPSNSFLKTPLKTAIAPYVLTVICRHHLEVNEALLALVQGYAKISLKGHDYDLNFLGADILYKINLKPFEMVENLACQCEKIIQTHCIQKVVENKEGKKK